VLCVTAPPLFPGIGKAFYIVKITFNVCHI
jgi:hypothetical protein